MRKYDARMKRGEKFVRTVDREGLLAYQKKTYPELYDLTVGHLFGDIWTRPHLNLRDRQLITLAANIALGRTSGNHSHYNSAMHIGIRKEQIIELIIHVGHYAGWPTMGLAIRQFNKVLKVNANEKKKKHPKRGEALAEAWEN